MASGGIGVIEEFRRYVDRIHVVTVNVRESVLHASSRVVSDDDSVLTDAARGRRRTTLGGHVNARVDAVLQPEPMCAGGAHFCRLGVHAWSGTKIRADNISAVVDAPGRCRRRARVMNGRGYKRFRCGCGCSGRICEKHRGSKYGCKSLKMESF